MAAPRGAPGTERRDRGGGRPGTEPRRVVSRGSDSTLLTVRPFRFRELRLPRRRRGDVATGSHQIVSASRSLGFEIQSGSVHLYFLTIYLSVPSVIFLRRSYPEATPYRWQVRFGRNYPRRETRPRRWRISRGVRQRKRKLEPFLCGLARFPGRFAGVESTATYSRWCSSDGNSSSQLLLGDPARAPPRRTERYRESDRGG